MEDLKKKTCKELRDIAKDLNIVGRWDMSKEELIKAIANASDCSNEEPIVEDDCNIKGSNSNQSEGSQKVTKTTKDYLNDAIPGTLVAFKRNNSKDIAMSGKFVSYENGKVIVESKKGTLFKLLPENIIWVKTGARWPKWVFDLFNKGSEEVHDDALS